MRAYSLNQMRELGIRTDEYELNDREGVYVGRLDYKAWGKSRNVLAFVTLTDGRKIATSAWQGDGYLGIPEIEEGTMLEFAFKKSKKGTPYLRKVQKVAPEESV